ncbi:MAG: DUF2267 domain-containing protein [bacterium]
MTAHEFTKRVMELADIQEKEVAEKAIQIVFSILRHRLTEEEASDVKSQLPHELKRVWDNHVWITNFFKLSGRKLKYHHVNELLTLVENEILRENLPLSADNITKAVIHTLKEQISFGETKDVIAILPDELKDYYRAA